MADRESAQYLLFFARTISDKALLQASGDFLGKYYELEMETVPFTSSPTPNKSTARSVAIVCYTVAWLIASNKDEVTGLTALIDTVVGQEDCTCEVLYTFKNLLIRQLEKV